MNSTHRVSGLTILLAIGVIAAFVLQAWNLLTCERWQETSVMICHEYGAEFRCEPEKVCVERKE